MRTSALALVVMVVTVVGVIGIGSLLWDSGTAAALQREPVSASPVTVVPVRLDDYLTNPGIGWQHAEGSGEQLLPETILYASRDTISWSVLNPAPDVFYWTPLDSWIATAAEQGKQISFRVYTMRGEDYGGHQVPEWVLASGAVLMANGEPDYSNCVYQAEWAHMVEALRSRYDGRVEIAFIDISGYGNFNEWSWRDGQTEWDEDALDPTSLDGQARRRLVDMFVGGSSETHECRTAEGEVETVAYDYAGFEQTQLVMPFAGVRQSIEYVISKDAGVGIRHDCLGRPGSTADVLEKIGDEIEDVWPTAPVIFELCSVSTEAEYMDEAARLLQAAHGSLVHDNLVEPRSAQAVESLMRTAGYRYVLSKMIYPSVVASGGTLPLLMDWQNTGTAPSYPRMGQSFVLHVGLLDSAGINMLDQVVETDIARWLPAATLPGDPPINGLQPVLGVPDYVPEGRYTLAVAILDQRTNQPIHLAIAGRTANGYYAIGKIQVGTGEAALTPVAPEVFVPTATPIPSATPDVTATPAPTVTPVIDAEPTRQHRRP